MTGEAFDGAWSAVELGEIKTGDLIRAESESRFRPPIAFVGQVYGIGTELSPLRLELDLMEPTLTGLDAKDYRFYRKGPS